MENKIFSKCGMRCDLCLIYRPNVEKEDRRVDICNAWRKIWQGFEPDPNTIICDGCYCEQYPCSIFPAEPSEEETVQKIEVEKCWTWEEEKLMDAYACKKYMDEFRKNR